MSDPEDSETPTVSLPPAVAGNTPLTDPTRSQPSTSAALSAEVARLTGTVDDFEIIRELGRGASGAVFLARQRSLDRRVALKVTEGFSEEARTMAKLEHPNIVQVFAEKQIRRDNRDLLLICMQYVPGPSLRQVLDQHAHDEPLEGARLLHLIDGYVGEPPRLDPSEHQARERLGAMDAVATICFVGEGLARAVSHANEHGVIHSDIKPANVMLSHSGRPLLADFSISRRGDDAGEIGGTLPYLAPEHLAAINADTLGTIDHRSDIYSIGVLLYELSAGDRPFPTPKGGSITQRVASMLAHVEGALPPLPESAASTPRLRRCIARCLQRDPQARFATATELANELADCRHVHAVDRGLPPPGLLTRALAARPLLALIGLVLVFNAIASAINIGYNGLQIVADLSVEQRTHFERSVVVYNAIMYPLCLWLAWRALAPVIRAHRQWRADTDIDPSVVAQTRRATLSMGVVSRVVALGWAPGALAFPLSLHFGSQGVGPVVFFHFVASVGVSGLVATTYTYLGLKWAALRVLYPHFLQWTPRAAAVARAELVDAPDRVRRALVLAAVIPLLGALLHLGVAPSDASGLAFRLLATSLIAAGVAGFFVTVSVVARVRTVVTVLEGSE